MFGTLIGFAVHIEMKHYDKPEYLLSLDHRYEQLVDLANYRTSTRTRKRPRPTTGKPGHWSPTTPPRRLWPRPPSTLQSFTPPENRSRITLVGVGCVG